MIALRRGFTVKDLAVTLTCLMVGASLLVSVTGATRDLSQAQVCANNLRQLFTGMTLYVNQYGSYPPHNPYPPYMSSKTVHGLTTGGFDPNIGFIMTHGLGLVPPATDTMGSGHFIWFGADFDSLPDVCKCPALPASLMKLNPEIDGGSLESFLYQYALSYQTSGTCRAPTPVIRPRTDTVCSLGGRNPPIPDPTRGLASAQQAYNAQNGVPYVWVTQHDPTAKPDANVEGPEYSCWIQAVNPSEVQLPSRIYYLADSRDYRPSPGGYPKAGFNSGWGTTYGNILLLGTRHFEYANVLYLDGRVSRDNQVHYVLWNLSYTPGYWASVHYRSSSFSTKIGLANISTQAHIMPVLMVKGWEYFFEANGVVAK